MQFSDLRCQIRAVFAKLRPCIELILLAIFLYLNAYHLMKSIYVKCHNYGGFTMGYGVVFFYILLQSSVILGLLLLTTNSKNRGKIYSGCG